MAIFSTTEFELLVFYFSFLFSEGESRVSHFLESRYLQM